MKTQFKKIALSTLTILVLFTSCASSEKNIDQKAISNAAPVMASETAPDRMKELEQEEFKKSAAESMAKLKQQIEISAIQNRNQKLDTKISWKCTAVSGQKTFSRTAKHALTAKDLAQKACESKKSSQSCLVSECTPKRI